MNPILAILKGLMFIRKFALLMCFTIGLVSTAHSAETFYVNKLKLVALFTKKLNQPFNFKSFEGDWLEPSRPDQVYPGSCNPTDLERDPRIEFRAQFDLAVSIERYRSEGGPHMSFTSTVVGGKTLLLDRTKNYGLGVFKGALVQWNNHGYPALTKYCVVIQPSEVSQLTSQPFSRPAKEFLVCKNTNYSYLFDPRKECVVSAENPSDEYSEAEIDRTSPRCIEIGLKNPCTHYNIYVRNH